MARKVRPIPKGFHTVTPTLNQADAAQTIAFCKKAFGAKVLSTLPAPGGKVMHAELQIGDSIVMLSDALRDPPRPSALFLYVPDVDKAFAKAVKAGAIVQMAPQDMFWGDRFARLGDAQGNVWELGTHREDVTPRELKKRVATLFAPQGA